MEFIIIAWYTLGRRSKGFQTFRRLCSCLHQWNTLTETESDWVDFDNTFDEYDEPPYKFKVEASMIDTRKLFPEAIGSPVGEEVLL